jgi:methionine-rich copper-binding protein CopC
VGGVSGFCYLTATKAADNAYTQTASRETIVVFTAYVPVITQGTTCTPTNTGTNATGIGTNSCQPIAPVAPTAPVGTGAPKITSLSATNGLVGASITITGTGFASVTKVQFGAKSTTTFTATATTITVNIPTGATTGRVMVFSPTGTAMASQIFTVTQLDTRAPSFVSGNVNTSVPAQITLNFDETLAATSLATSAISISVASIPRSINSLVISATTITLTLSSSVTAGQTVEFTYTSPDDSTAIQDAAGNKTATITATALTNTL